MLNCLKRIKKVTDNRFILDFPAWHRILKNTLIKSLVLRRPALNGECWKSEQMQQEYTIPTLSECSLLYQTNDVASPSHKDYHITAWLARGLDLAPYLLLGVLLREGSVRKEGRRDLSAHMQQACALLFVLENHTVLALIYKKVRNGNLEMTFPAIHSSIAKQFIWKGVNTHCSYYILLKFFQILKWKSASFDKNLFG